MKMFRMLGGCGISVERSVVRMAGLLVFAVLGSVLLFPSSSSAQAGFQVTKAAIKADATDYRGACPVTIRFRAAIMANGKGVVEYQWVRSDGWKSQPAKVSFPSAGLQTVETAWTLGRPGGGISGGFMGIEILAPNRMGAVRADFRIECADMKKEVQAGPKRPEAASGEKPRKELGFGGDIEKQKKADLVIRSAKFRETGKCEPHLPVFVFEVTVGNDGNAASPAVPGKELVGVKDRDGSGWSNGKELPAIPPGGSHAVEIPVAYLMADPGHMTAKAMHPFTVAADPWTLVDELNERNNVFPLGVPAPSACPKTEKPHS